MFYRPKQGRALPLSRGKAPADEAVRKFEGVLVVVTMEELKKALSGVEGVGRTVESPDEGVGNSRGKFPLKMTGTLTI